MAANRKMPATRFRFFSWVCRITFPPLTSRLGLKPSHEAKCCSVGHHFPSSVPNSATTVWMVIRFTPSMRMASTPVTRFNSAARSKDGGAFPPPVNTGGLHRHRLDPARFQPYCHSLQICRPASKLPYRLRIPPRRHRHEMAFIPNIDSGGVCMNHIQSRITRIQPPLQILPLLAVPTSQSLIGRCFRSQAFTRAPVAPGWGRL
jgi:hypothetical protein